MFQLSLHTRPDVFPFGVFSLNSFLPFIVVFLFYLINSFIDLFNILVFISSFNFFLLLIHSPFLFSQFRSFSFIYSFVTSYRNLLILCKTFSHFLFSHFCCQSYSFTLFFFNSKIILFHFLLFFLFVSSVFSITSLFT